VSTWYRARRKERAARKTQRALDRLHGRRASAPRHRGLGVGSGSGDGWADFVGDLVGALIEGLFKIFD
jgi:hypothetical protein